MNLLNPKLDAKTLRLYAEEGTDSQKLLVAQNPNTPLDCLAMLAPHFPLAVSQNPVLEMFALENPDAKSPYWVCRYYINAMHLVGDLCFAYENDKARWGKLFLILAALQKSHEQVATFKKAMRRKILKREELQHHLYIYAGCLGNYATACLRLDELSLNLSLCVTPEP